MILMIETIIILHTSSYLYLLWPLKEPFWIAYRNPWGSLKGTPGDPLKEPLGIPYYRNPSEGTPSIPIRGRWEVR